MQNSESPSLGVPDQQNHRNLLEIRNLRSSPKGYCIRNRVRNPAICVLTSPPGDLKASSSLRTTNLSDRSITAHGPYTPKQSSITGPCCFPVRYPVSLSWGVMHDSPSHNHPFPTTHGSEEPVRQAPPPCTYSLAAKG